VRVIVITFRLCFFIIVVLIFVLIIELNSY